MLKPNLTIDNSRLKIDNKNLLRDVQKTFVTSSITASDTTLTVQNITGAAVNGYIILGEIGSEKTEIVQIHASTSPSGTTITLATGDLPAYNHPTDTPVYFVDFNQVEFSRATTSGGSKSVLSTTAITPDQDYTIYNDTTNSTGYAYCRFKNSTGSTYSQYSDEQAYASMTQNQVGILINRILNISNTNTPKEVIMDFLKDGLQKIYEVKNIWDFEESTRDESNSYSTGTEEFTLPSDLKENNKQFIEVIYPDGKEALKFIDIEQFVKKNEGLARTTANGAITAADTSIVLTDSTNFPTAGTGYIGTDEFTWTGLTSSTHTLTGVSGVLDHDDGSLIFAEGSLGTPEYWTIFGSTARLQPTPDTNNNGKTLIIEYYKDLSDFDSENDTIPTPFWSLLVDYALMRIAERESKYTVADRYLKRFEQLLGQRVRMNKQNTILQLNCKE